jgi:PAS domain S-box-containing protein
MTLDFSLIDLIDKIVSPDRPRKMLTRYGLALVLPLACLAITSSFFQIDHSHFSPLFMLSIVSAALLGGIGPGIVATAMSVLVNTMTMEPASRLAVSTPKDWYRLLIFVAVGISISTIAGSIGALSRNVEIERCKLAVTLACIGDAVISTDVNGHVNFMNSPAEKATGWTSAEASGKSPEELFRIMHQKTRTIVENPIRQVLESGTVAGLAMHTVLVRRDGSELPISDSAAPIRNAQGQMIGTIMVFRDISTEMEREAAWLQTQRLASVGRLAATISHEINNPLQSTSNLLFLISKGNDLEAVQAYATAASQELLRASEIAKQTLSFIRGAGDRQFMLVGQVFDDVISLNRNKLKNKNIEVVCRYSPNTVIEAREGEIRQLIGNLIGNALDALKDDGRLYLRARPSACAGRPVIQFVVADTGSGISKEDLARVFEPFFTTKKNVGTGLGLWVVKKIIDGEGGCVHIRSRAGRGTVARICWPAANEKLDPLPRPANGFDGSVTRFLPRDRKGRLQTTSQ